MLLTPLVGYFLWKGDSQSTHICALLLIVAGITDGLDGYVARKLGQVSDFGKTLDPLADKLMAIVLIGLLIMFRDFPWWLAGVVVGRDLLILLAGLTLMRGEKIVVPSNWAGKYAFVAIIFLIGSYIYRFPTGITVLTWMTIVLVAISSLLYARLFLRLRGGQKLQIQPDRPMWKGLRTTFNISFLIVYFYGFFRFMGWV
ncbi:MAG: CDP-alcohol phosphatidyltransferase family protein [candidate division Zixibacteria bacterium]|nr:CDP-alcohol phosphatidyltransferase family protein [candidate division Zixibacteria bacterium]